MPDAGNQSSVPEELRAAVEAVVEAAGVDGGLPGADARADFWQRLGATLDDRPAPLLAALVSLLGGSRREPYRGLVARARARLRREEAGDERLLALFTAGPPPRVRGEGIEGVPCEAIDADEAVRLLGPSGPFAGRFASYEHRPGQEAMSRAVACAFNESRHLLAEGGTGIGKSLAYLVPAVLWATANRMPVVISTNTKNLQHQLFDKDLPLLRSVLDIPFEAALIKGRMNYVCLRKLLAAAGQPGEYMPEERARVAEVICWAAGSATGDLSECPTWGLDEARSLGARLTCSGEECMGRACRCGRRCFLARARARALGADVVVANHALVFAEMNILSPALPPYSRLVLDEAHNLEEAATKHFAVQISAPRLRFDLGRLWHAGPRRDGTGVVASVLRQVESGALGAGADPDQRKAVARQAWLTVDAIKAAGDAGEPLFEALALLLGRAEEPVRLTAPVRAAPAWPAVLDGAARLRERLERVLHETATLSQALRELAPGALPFHTELVHDLDGTAVRVREFLGDVDFVLRGEDPAFVYWVEPSERRQGGARAWGAPIHVGARLAEDLFGRKESVVLTSATLSVAGSFDFLRRRTGLDSLPEGAVLDFRAESPFDYARQCAVFVPTFLPEPGEEDGNYAEALAALLAELFRSSQGRGLALFTSYRMLRRVSSRLKHELGGSGIRVFAHGEDGSREAITRAFAEDVHSVLLGTHSFWEGVDLPGETLSCLVVARLPFALHTDPIVAARCEEIDARGGSAFMEYSLPGAVIRFRQGFGRLIRARTDRGVVVVTDRRLLTKPYGRWFRNSLPTRVAPFEDRATFLGAVGEFLA